MTPERRTRRSDNPVLAAQFYLETAARRGRYAALTVADADGLLVVDAPSAVNTEAVAAIAPFAEREGVELDGLLEMVTRGEALHVRSFELEGNQMYLAAVGGHAEPDQHAVHAMRRILGHAA